MKNSKKKKRNSYGSKKRKLYSSKTRKSSSRKNRKSNSAVKQTPKSVVKQTPSSAVKQTPNSAEKKGGRKIARRILTAVGIVLCVILIPIIVSNLVLIIKGYTNKDEVPSLFSISPMYVLTDSMVPTINGGDLIFIKKVASTEIAVEDVIAFFDPESMEGTMIVHRVKEISADGNGNITFRTMGDANNVYDTFVISSENLVGRYVFRMRGMGRVAMFMQSTYGLIVTVSVPFILLFGYEVIRRCIDLKKDQEDNTDTLKKSE